METIIVIVFSLIFIFCMRGVVCWYFKINERVKLQKELHKLLVNQTNSNGLRESSN